ncbi:MAG: sulfotransferase domain-containing protein [Reyranella sp.]|uniref:sulfotransferase domain-containing protein n=1 Tax=Reyranella sp. TaxID=1929291 RepID=UPI001AC2A95F|nr:sulfotransferase domain-containing protein [Reyranella sp.]MBN9088318.1 sulfotransferase domain-containing protein [Reyranella sp.]
MRYNIVVATHHKTGTVWMDGVFKAIAGDLGAQYINFRDDERRLGELLHSPFILFCYDSDFGDHASVLDRRDVRTVHLIRDPRDVVISAMHYHKASRESWLHEPIPGYDNLTYQRALQQLPTRFAQYIFEMENSSASTLRDMASWRYGRANCFEARYETLRQDSDFVYWRQITRFLGLDAAEQDLADRRFWQNSLFGGLSTLGNRHVRSGAVAQWRRTFTPAIANGFLKRFPGLLQGLRYETSDAWVRELRWAEEPGLLAGLRQLAADHWELLAERARLPSKF